MQKSRESTVWEREALNAKCRAAEERAAVGRGMAIAAGIVMRVWGCEVMARQILDSAGYESAERMKDDGVDQYDIDALTSLFTQ